MPTNRISYYVRKVKRAWSDATLWDKVRRKGWMSLYVPGRVLLDHRRLRRSDRRLALGDGFADHRGESGFRPVSEATARRIIAAYQAADAARDSAPEPLKVRGLWAEWIGVNYKPLVTALRESRVADLQQLLDNFNREGFAVGTGGGFDDYVKYRNSLIGRRYVRSVWCNYRDLFQSIEGDPAAVQYPLVGNPAGVRLNGSVVQVETLRHAYNARVIASLLRDVPDPVILEIGGGFGGQAHQTLLAAQGPISKYLLFDIPEVAAVCAAFLITAFPEKAVRLFGEGAVSASGSEQFDIGVFPHFTIPSVEDQSVDLVFNSNSFSEMDGAASGEYLNIVNRVCRRYFMHINHEVRFTFRNADGTTSVNRLGSEMVPDLTRFKRIYKRPRIFGRPEDKAFPAFAYLYQRM